MLVRESSQRHANRVARTTQKAEKKEPRTHDPRPYGRVSRRVDLVLALQEWAEDYEGTHSIFGD